MLSERVNLLLVTRDKGCYSIVGTRYNKGKKRRTHASKHRIDISKKTKLKVRLFRRVKTPAESFFRHPPPLSTKYYEAPNVNAVAQLKNYPL